MHSPKSSNIIFLTPYPHDIAPGQRFRFEQYLNILKNADHTISIHSFLSAKAYASLYKPGKVIQKTIDILLSCFKRMFHLLLMYKADYVFIFREAAPVGPPVFEWIIAKILNKKIIYDFDDAIWLTDKTNESALEKIIRWRSKVASICTWSEKVSCGNAYLANYARQFNPSVVINPTTIDCEKLHNPALFATKKKTNNVVIGWTGSHSTLKYLVLLEPVFQQLEAQFEYVSFLVIADQRPQLRLKRLDFIAWNPETEVEDLLKMDIGIMPLPNDEWSKGKCGFKALQYMALKIPAVVSPVGVNTEIITEGVEGFLCRTDEEWRLALEKLIGNEAMRAEMGKNGRQKVMDHYSVSSNTSNFLSLFE